jgi:glycosyltransferase involved in cell wall biosynthesis
MTAAPASRREAPLVSVIIPAYNAARFLPETLASAQAQTYPNLEIIVVDDGSTDHTPDHVMHVAETDRRIRLIRQPNAGAAAARNRGIEEARGEYLAPLDADDLWDPRFLAIMVDALRTRSKTDAAVAYSWSCFINERSNVFMYYRAPEFSSSRALFLAMVERLIIGNGSASVIRTEAARAVNGYSSFTRDHGVDNCNTRTFYAALAQDYRFVCVRQVLVGYRYHGAAMSRNRRNRERALSLVTDELLGRFPDLPEETAVRLRINLRAERLVRLLTERSFVRAGCDVAEALKSEPKNSLCVCRAISRCVCIALRLWASSRLPWGRPFGNARHVLQRCDDRRRGPDYPTYT